MLVDPQFADATLGDVLRNVASAAGERPALLGDARELTWAELDAEVDRIAGLLHEVGVRKGDVVAFMITKRPV